MIITNKNRAIQSNTRNEFNTNLNARWYCLVRVKREKAPCFRKIPQRNYYRR